MKKRYLLITILLLLVSVFATACTKSKTNRNCYDYLVLVNKYYQLVDAKNAWYEDIKVEK